jgi:hypothetical protein
MLDAGSHVVPVPSHVREAVLRVLYWDGPLRSQNAVVGRVPYQRIVAIRALNELHDEGIAIQGINGWYSDTVVAPDLRPEPKRRKRKRSGAQVSFHKAVEFVADELRCEGFSGSYATRLATRALRNALSDRQRALLDERSNGS